jgi:hypothetical protein
MLPLYHRHVPARRLEPHPGQHAVPVSASANGGGVAFFAHVGGFVFCLVVTRVLSGAGRVDAQQVPSGSRAEPAV